MKTSTAYNHFCRIRDRVTSIYSAARHYQPTHAQLLEDLKPALNDEALKRCPGWVRQAVNDLSGFLFHEIQQRYVVWMFKTPRGIMSYDLLNDAERDEVNKMDKPGKHYWIKETTPCVGTIANPGNYKSGDSFTRTFLVTDREW